MLILASPLIILVAVLLVGVHLPHQRLGAVLRLPSHRYAPIVVGIATGAVVWYVWGSLNAVAPVHDEASYLLQARTFATFHWAMPSPALPESATAVQVLVDGVLLFDDLIIPPGPAEFGLMAAGTASFDATAVTLVGPA